MIPDGNNVYGIVKAPGGLRPVLAAAQTLDCWRSARIKTSGYSGEQTIRLESEDADFETERLSESEHLFNGAVGGTLDQVINFVQRLSDALHAGGIDHHFEVYNAENDLAAAIAPR